IAKKKNNKNIKSIKFLVDFDVEYCIELSGSWSLGNSYYNKDYSGKDVKELIDKMASTLTKDEMSLEELHGEIYINKIQHITTIFGKKIDRNLADSYDWDNIIFMDDKE